MLKSRRNVTGRVTACNGKPQHEPELAEVFRLQGLPGSSPRPGPAAGAAHNGGPPGPGGQGAVVFHREGAQRGAAGPAVRHQGRRGGKRLGASGSITCQRQVHAHRRY